MFSGRNIRPEFHSNRRSQVALIAQLGEHRTGSVTAALVSIII